MNLQQRRILALTAFANFILGSIPAGMIGVAWPSMRAEFGVSLDALGTLLIVEMLGTILIGFFSGWLIARLGFGRYLLLNNMIRSLGLLGILFAPVWLVLLLVAFFSGLGFGGVDAGLNTYFASYHSPRLMNWLHACFGVGVTIGPLVMTAVLSQRLSWRWGYAVALVLELLVVGLYGWTARWWPVGRPETAVGGQETAVAPLGWSALRRSIVWLSMLVFFFTAGAEAATGNWAFTLFNEARGIDLATAGLWVSVYWGSFTIGRIFFGLIINWIQVNLLLRLNMAATAVGAVLLWWNPVNWVGFAGLALMGFALAPIFPLLISATPERVGQRYANQVIGFQVGMAGFGLSIIPWITGLLADSLGLETIGLSLLVTSCILFGLHEAVLMQSQAVSRPAESVPVEPTA